MVTLGSSIRRRRGRENGRDVAKLVGLGLLVLAAGLGAGYLFATELIFPAPEPPGELTEVPELHGLEESSAAEEIRDAGLVATTVDSIRHPTVPPGAVVGQSPLAGQQAVPGDSVRLTLSLGAERRAVPEVSEIHGNRALAVLEATGFRVEVDSVESETPRGTVVDVDPEAGTEMRLPGNVRLVVSRGPPMVEMPTLIGMGEDEALARVDSLGLVVSEVGTRFRFGLDQGVVVDQEPPPGAMVERGSAVRIVVGRRGDRAGNIRRPDAVDKRGFTEPQPPGHGPHR